MRNRTSKRRRQLLSGALCLLLLLPGCGGTEPPQPPANTPVTSEQPADTQPDPLKDPPKEPEAPAESPAESPAASPAEPEPEETPALEYCILDYASVSAHWTGEEGTLVVIKMQARNPGAKPFRADNTIPALGNVTTANAVDGMAADGIAAGKTSEQLTAWVWTDRNGKRTKPVIAAVEGTTAEIGAGQTVTMELYLLLPAEEGNWSRIDLLDRDVQLGYLKPKPAANAQRETSAAR